MENSHRIVIVQVFLTGGSGFIGGHLVDLLLAHGAEVTVLVRDPDKAASLRQKNVRLLKGDLLCIPALPADIDLVFHLAGRTRSLDSAAYYTVNEAGTASLCRSLLASRRRPKLIYLSSLAAVGPSREGRPVRESDPPHPVTPYGRSKWLGERKVLEHKDALRVVIVRPSAIFGPGDRDFLEYFRVIRKGIMPVVKAQKEASVCYVKDLVGSLWLCAITDVSSGEIFNIASPPPRTWEEVGDAAARAMGITAIKVAVPMSLIYAASILYELRSRATGRISLFNRDKYRDLRQSGWVADVEKAATVLGFRPRYSLEAGMRETIDWYRERLWL
jgi:dihydroflavonol-4-reductase